MGPEQNTFQMIRLIKRIVSCERCFLLRKEGGLMAKYQQWLEPEGLLLIEGWARDGLTDEQIAHNIGIAESTFYEWKKQFSEFSESLKKGKEVVDRMVENALLKRALGYSYSETTRERNKDTGEMVTTKVVEKEVVPDVTAQIFWLKNRKPDQWRDKPENKEVNGGVIIVDSIPEPDNSEPD